MSTPGQRKSALLLLSLAPRDRRHLLAKLPADTVGVLRGLMRELDAANLPLESLAATLLADDLRGITASTSLDVDQWLALADTLPAPWLARVLAAWTGVDRNFCIAMLDAPVAADVRRELDRVPPLPLKLLQAMQAESAAMASEAA